MVDIIKAYRQSVGTRRFIGKKYGDNDRVNGMFGAKWEEWHTKGWFDLIKKQNVGNNKEIGEDCDAPAGLMRCKADEPFEYWIGKFMPENTIVPDGFEYVDFPNIELGVCWVYGKEEEVYCLEDKCSDRLKEDGFEVVPDEKGAWWFFERYCCSRFDIPDDKGNIILDICHFIK